MLLVLLLSLFYRVFFFSITPFFADRHVCCFPTDPQGGLLERNSTERRVWLLGSRGRKFIKWQTYVWLSLDCKQWRCLYVPRYDIRNGTNWNVWIVRLYWCVWHVMIMCIQTRLIRFTPVRTWSPTNQNSNSIHDGGVALGPFDLLTTLSVACIQKGMWYNLTFNRPPGRSTKKWITTKS